MASDQIVTREMPELVFGIAGPIGVNVEEICNSLSDALRAVRYEQETIHLTKEMRKYALPNRTLDSEGNATFFDQVWHKMDYANALCEEAKDAATLARIGIFAITRRRALLAGEPDALPPKPTAYLVRQLKRPDEVTLFRKVYGKQFILVSAYGPVEQRQKLLEERIARSSPHSLAPEEVAAKALKLIARDDDEEKEDFGQRLRDTFHLADVFIDGLSKKEMDSKLTRFVQAFFGRTDMAPSKDEYGMYAAKSASLRSADLSRQVGAAIFSDEGELITQGCNEVPKAFGGTYWDLEEPDFRDVRLGTDPNDILKKDILRDVLDRM